MLSNEITKQQMDEQKAIERFQCAMAKMQESFTNINNKFKDSANVLEMTIELVDCESAQRELEEAKSEMIRIAKNIRIKR